MTAELTTKEKNRTRAKSKYLLKTGKLTKPDKCEGCQKAKRLQMHHTDYTRADIVQWLCTKCHGAAHVEPVADFEIEEQFERWEKERQYNEGPPPPPPDAPLCKCGKPRAWWGVPGDFMRLCDACAKIHNRRQCANRARRRRMIEQAAAELLAKRAATKPTAGRSIK